MSSMDIQLSSQNVSRKCHHFPQKPQHNNFPEISLTHTHVCVRVCVYVYVYVCNALIA